MYGTRASGECEHAAGAHQLSWRQLVNSQAAEVQRNQLRHAHKREGGLGRGGKLSAADRLPDRWQRGCRQAGRVCPTTAP